MSRYFAHYWNNSTWYWNQGSAAEPCNHAAGNLFRKRGVSLGDYVYVISVLDGRLHLGGRMEVGSILTCEQARTALGHDNLWKAEDHIVAKPGSGTPMIFDRAVEIETLKQIHCVTPKGDRPLAFSTPTSLDPQTLRGLRELTPHSAGLLDRIIDAKLEADASNTDAEDKDIFRVFADTAREETAPIPATDADAPLDHENILDERRFRNSLIVSRLGQNEFRQALLLAYEGRCAISGCNVKQTLQAAHIAAYRGPSTNRVSNGLLLRADLHNLFDSFLIAIDPEKLTLRVSISLHGSTYEYLAGKNLLIPDDQQARLDRKAIRRHFESFVEYEWAKISTADEEIEQARQNEVTYTTAEVMEHLKSL